ncbi:MAG: hypothetical protein H6713_17820 [Myxococcales bacterium]|nr:hypothetical protein [Myxococcales bacterium]
MTTANLSRLAVLLVAALTAGACDLQDIVDATASPSGPTALDSNQTIPPRPNPPTGPQGVTTGDTNASQGLQIGGITSEPRPTTPPSPRITS